MSTLTSNPTPSRTLLSPRVTRLWPVLAATSVVLAWPVLLWVALKVQVGPGMRELAQFGHLAALVVGFGAVLTVEWFGLLWLLRRRPLAAVMQVAQGAHLPIWLGLAGLVATGIVLAPAQLTAAGVVKLSAVLVVALNGIYAWHLQQRLVGAGHTGVGAAVPRSLLARMAAAALLSQLGWWTAVTIGFLSTRG